jgi:uncharacterized membrane protein YqaE (UPF0057 family)
MRTAISNAIELGVGYVLLAVHAYWVTSQCVTAYASGHVLGWDCTSALYTLPFSYGMPPLITVLLSRGSWAAGAVVAIALVLLGMELPNLSLAGHQWFSRAPAYYLAVVPATVGVVLGKYISRLRGPRVA